jgi:hypothetical protein
MRFRAPLLRRLGVVGSNPAAPTIFFKGLRAFRAPRAKALDTN